jgi:RNA polymerase sigma factor (sigma-70 family)
VAEHGDVVSHNILADATLVAAARDGDPAAWRALLERYDGLILAVCRAHGLSAADVADVRQTTWLRAVERFDRLRDPHRVNGWLATVARNECLRLLRLAARVEPFGEGDVPPHADVSDMPEARVLASERDSAVHAALSRLPERDRALIELLYSEPAPPYADIGRKLRMPVGSIGPTRSRVLARLRREAPVARLAAA